MPLLVYSLSSEKNKFKYEYLSYSSLGQISFINVFNKKHTQNKKNIKNMFS